METWMIFLWPETGLRACTLTGLAHEAGLRTKETCFGMLVEGEPGAIRGYVEGVRRRYSVYAKRRGFSIEDTRICASTFRHEGQPPWLSRYASQIKRYTS